MLWFSHFVYYSYKNIFKFLLGIPKVSVCVHVCSCVCAHMCVLFVCVAYVEARD